MRSRSSASSTESGATRRHRGSSPACSPTSSTSGRSSSPTGRVGRPGPSWSPCPAATDWRSTRRRSTWPGSRTSLPPRMPPRNGTSRAPRPRPTGPPWPCGGGTCSRTSATTTSWHRSGPAWTSCDASALESRIRAELELGHHSAVVAELGSLVAQHPLREGLHAELMLALYRSGRQSDALAAYRDLRSVLDTELGIEPSPPLQELNTKMLRQDPTLDWVAAAPAPVTIPALAPVRVSDPRPAPSLARSPNPAGRPHRRRGGRRGPGRRRDAAPGRGAGRGRRRAGQRGQRARRERPGRGVGPGRHQPDRRGRRRWRDLGAQRRGQHRPADQPVDARRGADHRGRSGPARAGRSPATTCGSPTPPTGR